MNQSAGQDVTRIIITRRTLYYTLLIGISIVSGFLLLLVPPVIPFGIILGAFLCMFILSSPYFGLLIFFATYVIMPAALYPPLAVFHPDKVFGIMVLLSLLLNMKFTKSKLSFVSNQLNYILVAFLVVMGLSVFTSFWPTQSAEATMDFAKILIFYFIVINLLTSEKRLKVFIWEYILLTGWLAFSSLYGYFTGDVVFAQGIERAYGVADIDPNNLAASLDFAIPFLYYMLYAERSNWLKILAIMILLASLTTIVLTGSRGALLGLATILFLIWLKSDRRILILTVSFLIGVISWVGMPQQYKERYKTILTTTSEIDPSSQGRIDAWKAGMNMFYDRPILGVGAGAFGTAHATSYTPEGKRKTWLKAHNTYVQLLSELGILGFIVFSIFVYTIIKQNIKLKRLILNELKTKNLNYYLSVAMMISFGCLLVYGIFGHTLYRLNWYLVAALTAVSVNLTIRELNSKNI